MKIVVAPDSFKGSLTSLEAAEAIKKGIHEVIPDADVVLKPMADGGEGTLEALLMAANGEKVELTSSGPLGDWISTHYGIIHGTTAVIECASIAGLTLVPQHLRNPELTTTYGIGEAILHALDKGCSSIIIGLGGSSTNDGGLGMLLALGMEALDDEGNPVEGFGKDLAFVNQISFQNLDPRLKDITIQVACDVDNPLCGLKGASYVYGPQKGATQEQVQKLDQALKRFGSLVENELNREPGELMDYPGAGAAGGLGFAFLALGGNLISGAHLVANSMNLEKEIQDAELVITGEGQSDEQTLYGKAPGYVQEVSSKYNVPVLLVSGGLKGDIDLLLSKFVGCFSIVNCPQSLEECMTNGEQLLYRQIKNIMSFYKNLLK